MHILNAHSSTTETHYQSGFDYKINGELLTISFEVNTKNESFYTSPNFNQDSIENWGLWDFDVLEIFLSSKENLPYLELQVSPLNQKFALIIEEPRKTWHYPKEWNDFDLDARVQNNVWRGNISINLGKVPNYKNTESLKANVFGIFGSPREYYAWVANPELKPDHHRPELFKELLC